MTIRAAMFGRLALAVAAMAGAGARAGDDQAARLRDEAFQGAQRAMASSAGAALSQLGARFAAGDDDLSRAVRARQDLSQSAARLERDVALARATPADGQAQRIARLRAEDEALQTRIAAQDDALRLRFPAYAELSRPQPLSTAAVQSLLGPDEALALIFVARNDAFVWAISRDGADWTRVERTREKFVADVKSLRAALNPQAYALLRSTTRSFAEPSVEGDEAQGRLVFDRALAAALYAALLKPLEPIFADKARLFIVANPPFDSLPPGLLVTEPPQGADVEPADLRATRWLIRRQSVVSLPSPGSLAALRRAQPARAPKLPFRGYGAPLLGGAQDATAVAAASGEVSSLYRGGALDRAALAQLAPLPQTEGELRALATALGADPQSVRVGAQATVSAVLSDDLAAYRVVAFATHGLLAGELTGLQEPALVFTPPAEPDAQDNGLLTASQAARLDLSADWVVLSACNTAGGDGAPGAEGFSGLARAFFYAGAKSLLVSHWPVRDDVAARLTTSMFARLRAEPGLSKAQAYRRAVLDVIDDARDPSLAHPAVWAPFVVVGEGR